MRRPTPRGFAKVQLCWIAAFLLGGFSCGPPEVRACHEFVDALRACTDRNAPASGLGEEDEHAACESADPACESFYECATAEPCTDEDGFFTISIAACEPPEGVRCL